MPEKGVEGLSLPSGEQRPAGSVREEIVQATAKLGANGNERAFAESVQQVPKADREEPQPPLSQREKFIRAAREAECDETGEAFERAFARAFPPRKPGEPVVPYVEKPPTKGSRRKAKAGSE